MISENEKKELLKDDPYWFEELFFRDLESWFSSDIACCDNCYDDFLKVWPHAYSANDNAFQCSSIGLDAFYSGSRLSDYYTEDEFFKYLKTIECPRCGSAFEYNIWAYELPFNVVNSFELKIKEIETLAQSTPFLLLKNSFANDVMDALFNLSTEVEPKFINYSLYRARVASQLKNLSASEFDFAPAQYVSEGRYNHAGHPVLYLGSNPETCYQEVRELPCYIAEIKITKNFKILDLTNTFDQDNDYSDLLSTLVYSALLSAKQTGNGQHKPEYIFSRFVSDCAKFAGFDAIKYPSTRLSKDNFNIVILNKKLSISNGSELVKIIEYKFT
ncbi:RES domain [Serratia fonticola]|uniref:RES family NAD+ phosphorylase n=1 Tax=Serratia fonticola TaxID=47917 RepID=UPI002178BB02|nr:RES family NAD+ phosphorylase [Serratia fonticola]CAI1515305.1 RES domain [Serratia fonticola]